MQSGLHRLKNGTAPRDRLVRGRGSGAAWDLRKAQPYECYSELDFDIPIGKNGDNYDRYCIRMEEMRQSVRIMKQCLEKLRLPEGRGPIAVRDNKIVPPPRAEMKRSMEATIPSSLLYFKSEPSGEGWPTRAGERPAPWTLPQNLIDEARALADGRIPLPEPERVPWDVLIAQAVNWDIPERLAA
jgi:hypothetical protein